MNQSELARIFERYYTTKSSGTGLGLPIVQRIINSHEGTICAESESGEGTTFRIELPIR
jgi:signal transduction histidine kinase